ncbi:MAG: YWFCY domain-containing protein [Prevotellaceae bacterium]|jgi:hypothetical protein|nr:YWFCY domain-containing protein [Prevotellaceae bacterium]
MQEFDEKGLTGILHTIRAGSVIILLVHFYWFCFSFFAAAGIWHPQVNAALLKFQQSNGMFSHPIITQVMCVLLLAVSCFGAKGKKDEKFSWSMVNGRLVAGCILFFMTWWIRNLSFLPMPVRGAAYILALSAGYILLLSAGSIASRILRQNLMKDRFNIKNESFEQEARYLTNPNPKIPTIHLRSKFYYKNRWNDGWINVVNPHRATSVLGTPGSGKSYAVINSYIKQLIEQGNALYVYDYKFPDLTSIVFNHYRLHPEGYTGVKPQVYIINFDDPRKSHRCNPLNPAFMTDIADAYESSYVIMLNLNRTWAKKQGEFFVESPIVLFAAIIWFLKMYEGGRYCTLPHAIEILTAKYEDFFPVLMSYPMLEAYVKSFVNAYEGGAMEQLQGQIASAQIPIARMVSPEIYWVLSGDDFSLDINNPQEPKILCVGNNPKRENIYATALGLLNARIVQLVNRKGQLPCGIIIDELPTMYFRKIDNLINTARSNLVTVCLGFQDYSQLKRDYGEDEYQVITNTVGNVFAGQVLGNTAKNLQERFGKVLQERQNISINRQDTSTSINTQMDLLIPAGKIANLRQGTFVGTVVEDFGIEMVQNIFHAEIVVDHAKVKREEKQYVPLPVITSFIQDGVDVKDEIIEANFRQIKADVAGIIKRELDRIQDDPELQHLLTKQE